MAVQRLDNQVVGSSIITKTTTDKFAGVTIGTSEISSISNIYGTLLNFSNIAYKGENVFGTYNTFQDTQAQIQATQNILSDPTALSISDLNTTLSSSSLKNNTNPFFSTFFNYYLGLAQDRQANLSKNLGRSDLLSNGSLL